MAPNMAAMPGTPPVKAVLAATGLVIAGLETANTLSESRHSTQQDSGESHKSAPESTPFLGESSYDNVIRDAARNLSTPMAVPEFPGQPQQATRERPIRVRHSGGSNFGINVPFPFSLFVVAGHFLVGIVDNDNWS